VLILRTADSAEDQLQNCGDYVQSEVKRHYCLPGVYTEQLYSCANITLFRQEYAICK